MNSSQAQPVTMTYRPLLNRTTYMGHFLVNTIDPRQKHKTAILRLGLSESIVGAIMAFLSIITLVVASQGSHTPYFFPTPTYIAQGLWGGIINMVTGYLGYRLKYQPTKAMHIVNMVMAIITANVSAVIVIMSGIAAVASTGSISLIPLHLIIGLLGFSTMIVNIVHASFSCSGACYDYSPIVNQPVAFASESQPDQSLDAHDDDQLFIVSEQSTSAQDACDSMTSQQNRLIQGQLAMRALKRDEDGRNNLNQQTDEPTNGVPSDSRRQFQYGQLRNSDFMRVGDCASTFDDVR